MSFNVFAQVFSQVPVNIAPLPVTSTQRSRTFEIGCCGLIRITKFVLLADVPGGVNEKFRVLTLTSTSSASGVPSILTSLRESALGTSSLHWPVPEYIGCSDIPYRVHLHLGWCCWPGCHQIAEFLRSH